MRVRLIYLLPALVLAACSRPPGHYTYHPDQAVPADVKHVTPYDYQNPDEATHNRLAGCAFPTFMPPTYVWCKSGT
ncbi:hypothetical protein GC177_02100 [bacterium]|nr:hypothetical protein [bacterium]